MHQAFDRYAKGMGETQRNEWLKEQGRFESIPFLESSEQTLRVVAAAFKHKLNAEQWDDIQQQTVETISVLAQHQALPSSMSQDVAQDVLSQCYPLHPIAALLLPVLCQKVAQNERTLFSYLGSQEHYGFHDGLKRLKKMGDWVLAWEVFEYFILNQSIMTADYATHRRWIEVLNAIERLGDAKESEIQLLPPSNDNPYQLFHLWEGIDQFLDVTTTPQPLKALYDHLQKPPYGVQTGALSLIFIAYYLSKQRTLALYESGTFCSHVTQEHFEILLKRPELFSVESFTFSGVQSELFNQYLEKLVGKSPEDSALLDIVKPLAKFIHKLPAFTLATKELEAQAIAVRDAFQSTQSPMELLFTRLPEACSFPSYQNEETFNESNPSHFLNILVQNLNSLNKAYDALLDKFSKQLIQAFSLDKNTDIKSLREQLTQRYAGLENYTVDGQGLKAFIIRLQNTKETDKGWLKSVAALLGKAPADKWKQNNITKADYNLTELSERLKQLWPGPVKKIRFLIDAKRCYLSPNL